jgi:hypothetical protein
MSRDRESLILKLQERNTEIDNEIKRLQQDWTLNQQIITELQKEDKPFSEEDSDISIEYLRVEDITERKPIPKKTEKKISHKKVERREELERARAWHLDRIKAKRK